MKEQTETEKALRKSETRLSLAADSAEAGLWELDCDTGLIWTTDRALAIFGYNAGETITMARFERSVSSDDLGYVRQAISRSLNNREPLSVEYRILLANGEMKWIYSRGRPYYKPDGTPALLLGISIDISERKAAEAQQIRNEERLISAIDIAALGFYEMGENHRIIFADDRLREILGLPPEVEADARRFWLEHIYQEDLERVLDVSRKVLEQGVNRFAVEYRYIHPGRGLTWLNHLSRTLKRDKAGRATHVIGVVQDITEQKLKDIALRESMERYRAMVEAYDGFVYICSDDFRIEYMNPRLIERTGRDAVDELCYKVLHDRNSVCPWCVNERVFRGETVRWEVQSPKDNAWYYVVNTPIEHTDGSRSKMAMILDITDRRRMEEQLRENADSLRNNQKDLQRLAGRLIKGKEEELRRLSRELHDDLTQRLAVLAIEAGTLELQMHETTLPLPQQLQIISKIKKQLIEVSEDVHRISRQLHPTILDDLGLVRAIESECAALQQREDIMINFIRENVPDDIANDIPLCLYRIVQEGLHNIINHSGAPSCEVVLQGSDAAVSLTVRDEGVGFDPEEVRNKPGLGLSSMRERVQLAGGTFAIDAGPGRGTAIHVIIPLERRVE